MKNLEEELVHSASVDELEFAKCLIENGIGSISSNVGLTLACNNNHLDMVKYLIETEGVDIHAQEDEALITASLWGYIEVVEYLVSKGANIHARNGEILLIACHRNSVAMVKYLISQGIDVNTQEGKALKISCMYGYIDIYKILKEAGGKEHIV